MKFYHLVAFTSLVKRPVIYGPIMPGIVATPFDMPNRIPSKESGLTFFHVQKFYQVVYTSILRCYVQKVNKKSSAT